MLALMTAGVLCLMFGIFLMSQPDDEDIKAQIKEKVAAVKPYLAKEFPGETWTISTVPFQKAGYEHNNPYVITVVFENEPDASYEYEVDPKGHVTQSCFYIELPPPTLRGGGFLSYPT
ncbi:hypothetical protein [Exiguobacterium artemiae]|uniref:hypothetical protein n=1 Tax=Exiguobacterium artemiae TaxID=340145 RepID=UPI003D0539CF